MSRWLTIAGVVLLALWAPFLYSELTSAPAEKKARAGVDEELDDEAPTPSDPEGEDEPPEDEVEDQDPEPAEPAAEDEEPAEVQEPAETTTAAAEQAAEEEGEGEEQAEEGEGPQPGAPIVSPIAAGPTAVLKSAYEVEHRDAFWAPGAEARIVALFERVEAPEGALESAECHKRVCRVELAWTQEQASVYADVYGAIREEFGMEVGVEPIINTQAQEGEASVQKVVLYLPRKGYSVADLVE
jgi:hypothetical protein